MMSKLAIHSSKSVLVDAHRNPAVDRVVHQALRYLRSPCSCYFEKEYIRFEEGLDQTARFPRLDHSLPNRPVREMVSFNVYGNAPLAEILVGEWMPVKPVSEFSGIAAEAVDQCFSGLIQKYPASRPSLAALLASLAGKYPSVAHQTPVELFEIVCRLQRITKTVVAVVRDNDIPAEMYSLAFWYKYDETLTLAQQRDPVAFRWLTDRNVGAISWKNESGLSERTDYLIALAGSGMHPTAIIYLLDALQGVINASSAISRVNRLLRYAVDHVFPYMGSSIFGCEAFIDVSCHMVDEMIISDPKWQQLVKEVTLPEEDNPYLTDAVAEESITTYGGGGWDIDQADALGENYAGLRHFAGYVSSAGWRVPAFALGLAQKIGLFPGHPRLLDIGCFDGPLLDILVDERNRQLGAAVHDYFGIDFSSAAIAAARAKYSSYRFIYGDALDPESYVSIPDASRDGVFCLGVCDYLNPSQIGNLLIHIRQKLAVGGKVILTYRPTTAAYNVPEQYSVLSTIGLSLFTKTIDGVTVYQMEDTNIPGLLYHLYDPADIRKLAIAAGLQIDEASSYSTYSDNRGPRNTYDFIVLML